ncbi:MAG: hypothetical protein QXP77_00665 [Candidatus Aenigmatarchaeota archaeon]
METESIEWLKKIKDGSILSYLKEIDEIEKIEMPKYSKKLLYEIVDANKKGKFPQRKELIKKLNISESVFYKYINYLKSKNLIIDFTAVEVLYVFKKSGEYKMKLPSELYMTIQNEIERLKVRSGGSSKSWIKKFQNPRAFAYSRFYIALLLENKLPVFYNSFSFIPIYNSFVAPQKGHIHISLK